MAALRDAPVLVLEDDVEVSEVAWVPLQELPSRLAYADERRLIRRATELLEETAAGEPASKLQVIDEATITELFTDGGTVKGAFGYRRGTGRFARWGASRTMVGSGRPPTGRTRRCWGSTSRR